MSESMNAEDVLESILTASGPVRITSKEGDEAVVRIEEQSDPFDVQALRIEVLEGDVPGDESRAQIRSEQNDDDSSWSRPVVYWVVPADEDVKSEWRIAEAEEVLSDGD